MFFTHLKQKLPRCTSAGGNLPLHLDSYLFPVMDIDPLLSGFAGETAALEVKERNVPWVCGGFGNRPVCTVLSAVLSPS